ncbi:MAG: LCP family protein, partial [Eubacteriales bacterium]
AVGGVEVTMEEDVELGKYFFKAGETVLLEGEMAYWFLKYRDVTIFDSASDRLNRQKLYLNSLLYKMIEVVKHDVSIVNHVYEIAKEYMVTDISLEEMAYMATTLGVYEFHMEDMYSLEGETITGELYEEFYVDTQAMYELILDVFYVEVKE